MHQKYVEPSKKFADMIVKDISNCKVIFKEIELKINKIEDLGFRNGEHNGLILKNSAFFMTSLAFYKAVVKNKAAQSSCEFSLVC